LIELLLVLGIISLFVIISIVEVRGVLDNSRLRIAARQISNDIRYAQQLAIAKKSDETKVIFNDMDQSFMIVQNGKVLKFTSLPKGVVFEAITFNNRECKFNKRGNPAIGGSVYIRAGDKYYTITVLVATGRVRIYDYKVLR